MDSAPTPSDDFLLQKLLEKRSSRKGKRQLILDKIERVLKSGLHVYQFWNSSVDDAFNSDYRIYLTIDSTVYPWLISYDEWASQLPFVRYIKQLNSPVITYPDVWTTVCTNLGWKSGMFVSPVTGTNVNASDLMTTVRTRELAAFPITSAGTYDRLRELDYERVSIDGAGLRRQVIYVISPRDMLRFLDNSVFTNQYLQDYLNASEANVQDDNPIIDENRIGQGWKLAFYGMIAFRCPQNFNPDEELTTLLWNNGRRDLIAVRFDGSNNNIQTPLNIGQGYTLETNQFNFVQFLDTYQAYIYSSLDKQVEDLYKAFGVRIKRDKIIVPFNRITIKEIPGYQGAANLYEWYSKQIRHFSSVNTTFSGYAGLYYSKFGKRWLYLDIQSLNAILQYLYNTSPITDQIFKTVQFGQSQNLGEQFNDPSKYGSGTQAFDFSGGN